MESGKQGPVARYRAGGVSAALWENTVSTANGRSRTVMKATLAKTYKDRNGNWSNSRSLNADDIPKAIYCLQKCWETMLSERHVGNNAEEAVA